MTTFAAVASTPDAKAPDTTKHVNYSYGMVLGVDDFNQEFAYLAGRDRWLTRDAIGYGTLCGLSIGRDAGSKGPRITVTSGSAITPRGQLVCVKPDQCAELNDWLAAHNRDISSLLGSPFSGTLQLYLTLCYRDCPIDLVPIPGGPCRSEDEMMSPSRLVDDFSLELRTTPPLQAEEQLVGEFVRWLQLLQFGGGGPYATLAEFEAALRAALPSITSPLASPLASPLDVHLGFASPLTSKQLDPALKADYYRVAFRVWAVEIRPLVHALCGCGGGCCTSTEKKRVPKTDECVLLARVEVPVVLSSGRWLVDDTGEVKIDESERPVLVHMRLLQEFMRVL
jgi:hypothetical protein